jgi:tetratricopeptide (TPR) repeat protein
LLALRLAAGFYFNLGDSANLRDSVARVLPSWAEDMTGFGYTLGMYAFGLEECGEYTRAEDTGRRAVAINDKDIWAVHAAAHVMEMQGRTADGIAWLSDTESGWAGCNFFAHHVWWHKALYHIERGDGDDALALYDKRVRDHFSDIIYDIHDAASLLWRLELAGLDVGLRWGELADKSAARIDEHNDPFTDVHFMMCLAGDGRGGAAEDMVASMRSFAATRKGTTAPIMREVGIAACEGLAVDKLLPIRYALYRIGGSHAQRDLFAATLIEAALGCGRHGLARALTAERCASRPGNAPAWTLHARALDGLGAADGASAARDRADNHGSQ